MEEIVEYRESNGFDFIKRLNDNPKEDDIRINEYADNTKYIPISFLEMKLDEMVNGLWSTKSFNTKIIGNEICGEIELHYFHPIYKTWLCRVGAASVLVRQKKGAEITDITAKIKNALVLDYPHLKAECFRNACSSIGKTFGRDLNREFVAGMPDAFVEEEIDELKVRLSEFTDFDELKSTAILLRNEFIEKGLNKLMVEKTINKRLMEIKEKVR